MEAKRQSILDMACAGADKKAIAKLTGANITTVRRACSLSLVLPAGISILLVWILFLAGIVRFLLIIFQSRPTTNRLKKEPIYDEVHRDDNYL
ncbi:hypothetical protein TCAL_17072 [Tigriopus californicus]|uniref:Uncharacterized protein n=1 Tax=Tigriopus californicus TaxID=6832 RepID=A0A553PQ92_TIGCA|nr:hypothetical protein TCAL_17072 [Tigriopus californicus]